MTKYEENAIRLKLEYLNKQIEIWQNYREQGSNDRTYDLTCSAKILEATAELEGMTYVLDVLGYSVEKITTKNDFVVDILSKS